MKILKRRKEHKTNYSKRLKLLKSNLPRIIFRRTNRYIISQYILSNEAKDKIIIGANSKELLKKGWPEKFKNSLKSIPACYLTGLLLGEKIKEKRLEKKIVMDLGLLNKTHKSKAFAFIKGLKDNEIIFECSEEFFPDNEKISGKFMKEDFSKEFNKIKENIKK